jgi:5-methylcytosine-specific restriction endonuclease McrBC regulatory subunit McrC
MCENKIKAEDFFRDKIKDNSEYILNECIDIKKYFNGTRADNTTKQNIEEFLKKLHYKLSSLSPNEVIFADEYENTTLNVFDIEGYSFDNLKIITGNIVGSIKFDNIDFNISSRFGNKFLQYMIAGADGFLEYEDMGGLDTNTSLGEWLLVYLWKIKLKKATALGMYKSYENFTEDLRTIKGSIDFSKIDKFKYKKKLRCNYREHSYDNEINYTIKLALNKAFKKYKNLTNDIAYIKRGFDEIRHPKSQKNEILNPYFLPYKEVYTLSRKILKDEFASFGKNDFNALLFDVSMLFEHHIRKLFIKHGFIIDEKNRAQFKIPKGKGEANLFPDIIIKHDDKTISIYDVKYKKFKDGVEREDRFQLVSYVAIYSQRYNVKDCGFIYPTTHNQKNLKQTLKICNKEIPFNVKFYKVAKSDNNEFKKNQMQIDEEFIKDFKD